jgi:hypothetical protein
VQLGDDLDAGEARSGEDERQPRGSLLRHGVGELDLAQDVIAQPDRVGQVLQARACSPRPGTFGTRVVAPERHRLI